MISSLVVENMRGFRSVRKIWKNNNCRNLVRKIQFK